MICHSTPTTMFFRGCDFPLLVLPFSGECTLHFCQESTTSMDSVDFSESATADLQRIWCGMGTATKSSTESCLTLGGAVPLRSSAADASYSDPSACWPHSVQSKGTLNCRDDFSLTRAPKFCWTHPQRVLSSSSSLYTGPDTERRHRQLFLDSMCCGAVPFLVGLVVVSCMTLSTPYEKSKFFALWEEYYSPCSCVHWPKSCFAADDAPRGCGMYMSRFAGDCQEWSLRLNYASARENSLGRDTVRIDRLFALS